MIPTFASEGRRSTAAQPLDLQPGSLPLIGVPSTGLRIVSALLSHLRHFFHRDEPGSAVLRDLGLDGERRDGTFDFADLHGGLESARMRSLDACQGWRGS